MADDIQLEFPVLKDGKAVAPSAAKQPKAAEPEIKLEYPKPENIGMTTLREKAKADSAADLERLRGLTFGLSDRALALIRSGKYEDNLNQIQDERDQYRADHPYAAIGNGMLGGIASGGLVSGGLKKLGAALLPKVASYAQTAGLGPLAVRLGQVAGEGAVLGETTHQMEQRPGKIGTDLGRGAAVGALSSLAGTAGIKSAEVLAKLGARNAQRLALAAGAIKPENFANKKFTTSLADQNLTPDDVAAAMKYLRGDDLQIHGPAPAGETMPDLRPPVRVADAVPKGTLNTIKRAVKSSDRATTDVTEAMRNRNAEQGMRLQNNVTSTLSDDVNSSAAQEALQLKRAAAAKPHYDQAYKVGAPDSPLIDAWIKDRPVNAQLFRELEANLNANASKGLGAGKPMTAKLTVDPITQELKWEKRPTVEDLDTIKKYIDSKRTELWDPIRMQFRKPRQLGSSDAEQLGNQRDDLIKIIDKLTPDGKGGSHYANARKAFADDSELIEAHRAGQSIVRTRPEDVARQFDKYSGQPELQDQYRAGVAASINDLIDKADTEGGSAIVRKLYGSKGMQKKLTYVMGNDSTRQLFDRNMGTEKVMVDTAKELAPKSSPNDLLSDAEGFSLPLAAVHALSGRFGAAANQLSRFGTGSIGGMAPEVGDQLAKLALMTPEEFALWNAANKAAQQTFGAKAGRAVGALGRLGLNGVPPALAGQSGRMVDDFKPQNDDQNY